MLEEGEGGGEVANKEVGVSCYVEVVPLMCPVLPSSVTL